MNEINEIKRLLERLAMERAVNWVKERKILDGKYPTTEEFFKKKVEFKEQLIEVLKKEV